MRAGRVALVFLVLLALIAVAYSLRNRLGFDTHAFLDQFRRVHFLSVLLAIVLIYATYLLRSWRWTIFLRAHRAMPPLSLTGAQFTGFSAVAIFGRIADLSRPYLIARKTGVPLPVQLAIYTIERMFDLGAAALVFSSALLFASKSMPHRELFMRVGIGSFAGTLLLASLAIAIRVGGVRFAAIAGRLTGRISPAFGKSVEERILVFRTGLAAVNSASDFVVPTLLSIAIVVLVALAYRQTAHAFVAEPTLARLDITRTMLIVAASIGGSLLQLPVLGWLTQIATTAGVMRGLFGTPLAPATACGALLLVVSWLCVIPAGLFFAQREGIGLRELTGKSESLAEGADPPR